MTINIKEILVFNNRTSNGESDAQYFENGTILSVIISGSLNDAAIRFKISYDGVTYHYYINNGDIFEQQIEGKEISIKENIPFYIKAELLNADVNTSVTLKYYYSDFYKNYGIIK